MRKGKLSLLHLGFVVLAVQFSLWLYMGCEGGSCADYANPNVSSAITNREMLELAKEQNALLKRTNVLLDSIRVELAKRKP